MKQKRIALVKGDGSGPEMMEVACKIAIEEAVIHVLKDGYRTSDISSSADDPKKILGTKAMGEKVLSYM